MRIAGDESLGQSFAAQIRQDQQRLRDARGLALDRQAIWDGALQRLEESISLPSGGLEAAREALESARRTEGQARNDLATTSKTLDQLLRMSDLVDAMAQAQRELPELERERADVSRQSAELRGLLDRLDDQARELHAKVQQDVQAFDEIFQMDRLARLRKERLIRRQTEEQSLLHQLGENKDREYTERQLKERLTVARRRLQELQRQLTTSDKSVIVIDVADQLDAVLRIAIHRGLGEEGIVDTGDAVLTTSQLQGGVQRRRRDVAAAMNAETVSLRGQVISLKQEIALLERLAEAVRLRLRAEEDLQKVLRQIEGLLSKVSSNDAERVRELTEQRIEIIGQLESLAARTQAISSRIEQLTSLGSVEEMRHELTKLGWTPNTDIAYQVAQADRDRHECELRLAQAREARVAAEGAESQVLAILARTVTELRSKEYRWLTAAGVEPPDPSGRPEAQAKDLSRLYEASQRLRGHLEQVPNIFDALDEVIERLAQGLQVSQALETPSQDRRFDETVRQYYEQLFSAQLSGDEIRHALFDSGSDINLDLTAMTTTWTTPTGERRTRPLEAFSSGERAFAYTRVRLESLGNDRAINQVVFLDEFGAYVAADRIADLLAFLRKRVLGRLVDQVVMILPLGTPRPRTPADVDYLTDDLTTATTVELAASSGS
ncbi:MAG: hypothetical protein ACJ74O_17845 [Frankiaceae bacterium]